MPKVKGAERKSIDVPFYITPDSLKGRLYSADEFMKDFYGKTDRAKGIFWFHETAILIYEMVFMGIRNQQPIRELYIGIIKYVRETLIKAFPALDLCCKAA